MHNKFFLERGHDMSLAKIINDYGKMSSPYKRGLVNHLPMGQLAFYKLTEDIERLKKYSEEYDGRSKINPVKTQYSKKESLEECLGNRQLYEACLDIVKEKLEKEDLQDLLSYIVNKYQLGMSSGVFHTIIRLAYGVEGYELDKELKDEIERGLAYYITAYREAELFERKIQAYQIIDEMKRLATNVHIDQLILDKESLGQRMKALYDDEEYVKELGFIIEGSPQEKIRALLDLLIPTYLNSGNIVVLHCITGLHALTVLERYYYDYGKAIDILTTCIITHIISLDLKDHKDNLEDNTHLSWDYLKIKASESRDVHAVKLTYSAYQLYKVYEIPKLKDVALKRIRHG